MSTDSPDHHDDRVRDPSPARDELSALVREMFERLATGDSTLLVSSLDPDVTWTVAGTTSTWCGTWTGISEVLDGLLRPVSRLCQQPYRVVARSIATAGDRVFVEAEGLNATLTNKRYENSYCFVFGASGDGSIDSVVEYADTALMEAALGPCPSPPTLRRRPQATGPAARLGAAALSVDG